MNIDTNILLLNENSSSRMFSEVEKHINRDFPKNGILNHQIKLILHKR